MVIEPHMVSRETKCPAGKYSFSMVSYATSSSSCPFSNLADKLLPGSLLNFPGILCASNFKWVFLFIYLPSISVYLSLSAYLFLTVCLSSSICPPISICLCIYLYLSISLFLPIYLYLSSLSLCLSLPLCRPSQSKLTSILSCPLPSDQHTQHQN